MKEYTLNISPEGNVTTEQASSESGSLDKIIKALTSSFVNVDEVQRLIAEEMARLAKAMETSHDVTFVETSYIRSLGERIKALRELGRQVATLRK